MATVPPVPPRITDLPSAPPTIAEMEANLATFAASGMADPTTVEQMRAMLAAEKARQAEN